MEESDSRKRLASDEDEVLIVENEPTDLNGVLPLSRVKKLVKMSANSASVSADAAKLIQLCAEEYLRSLARTTATYCKEEGRKAIQVKDVDHVINNDWAFVLLEGALTDWPNDENTLWFDESTPNSDNF